MQTQIILLLFTFLVNVSASNQHLICKSINDVFPEHPDRYGNSMNSTAHRIETQGKPGKMGPVGPRGYPGQRGTKGEPGYVDYNNISDIVERKVCQVLENLTEEKVRLAEKLQKYEERNGQLQQQSEASRNLTEHLTDRLQKAREKIENLQNETKNCMPMPGLMTCNGRPLRSIREASAEGKVALIQRYASMDGNWTVFQRRKDGSVDFARNWTEYVKGFGTPCGEYWLGLETIYQLTKNGDQKLRIDMIENGTGIHYWAEYSSFQIAASSTNYTLTVKGYSGNATDSMIAVNSGNAATGKQFSTIDADNDIHQNYNCASQSGGGWWQGSCSTSRLNGRYGGKRYEGIAWYNTKIRNVMQMKFVEMKVAKNN